MFSKWFTATLWLSFSDSPIWWFEVWCGRDTTKGNGFQKFQNKKKMQTRNSELLPCLQLVPVQRHQIARSRPSCSPACARLTSCRDVTGDTLSWNRRGWRANTLRSIVMFIATSAMFAQVALPANVLILETQLAFPNTTVASSADRLLLLI